MTLQLLTAGAHEGECRPKDKISTFTRSEINIFRHNSLNGHSRFVEIEMLPSFQKRNKNCLVDSSNLVVEISALTITQINSFAWFSALGASITIVSPLELR